MAEVTVKPLGKCKEVAASMSPELFAKVEARAQQLLAEHEYANPNNAYAQAAMELAGANKKYMKALGETAMKIPSPKPEKPVIKTLDDARTLIQTLRGPAAKYREGMLAVLGFDKDGNDLSAQGLPRLTLKKAGQLAGDADHTGISKAMNAIGLTKEVRDNLAAERADNAYADELGKMLEGSHEDSERSAAMQESLTIREGKDSGAAVDATGRGELGEQKWFRALANKGLRRATDQEIIEAMHRAIAYVEKPGSFEAFKQLMAEVDIRQRDPRFVHLYERTLDKQRAEIEDEAAHEVDLQGDSARNGEGSDVGHESVGVRGLGDELRQATDQLGESGKPAAEAASGDGAGARPAVEVKVKKKRTIVRESDIEDKAAPITKSVVTAGERIGKPLSMDVRAKAGDVPPRYSSQEFADANGMVVRKHDEKSTRALDAALETLRQSPYGKFFENAFRNAVSMTALFHADPNGRMAYAGAWFSPTNGIMAFRTDKGGLYEAMTKPHDKEAANRAVMDTAHELTHAADNMMGELHLGPGREASSDGPNSPYRSNIQLTNEGVRARVGAALKEALIAHQELLNEPPSNPAEDFAFRKLDYALGQLRGMLELMSRGKVFDQDTIAATQRRAAAELMAVSTEMALAMPRVMELMLPTGFEFTTRLLRSEDPAKLFGFGATNGRTESGLRGSTTRMAEAGDGLRGEVRGRADADLRADLGGVRATTAQGSGDGGRGGRVPPKGPSEPGQGSGREFERARAEAAKAVPQAARAAVTNTADFMQRHVPALMATYQIVHSFKDKLPSLVKFDRAQQNLIVDRLRIESLGHDLIGRMGELKNPQKLYDVMMEATLKGLHPDAQKASSPEHADLMAKFNALSKEEQAVYKDATKLTKQLLEEHKAAFGSAIDAVYSRMILDANERGDHQRALELADEAEQAVKSNGERMSTLQGPYFPLMRKGDYLSIGESKQLLAERKKLADMEGSDVPNKESLAKQRELVQKMETQGAHYVVEAHETAAQQREALKRYEQLGLGARSSMADQHLRELNGFSRQTMENLEHALDTNFKGPQAAAFKELLQKAYVASLPENHALARRLKRQGIEGANTDMRWAMAAMLQRDAFYLSRMRGMKDMNNALYDMKAEAKGVNDLMHIQREMEQRLALDMAYKPTPVQDAVSSLAYFYHLGVTPAYLLTNMTQPFMITTPLLGGDHGMYKAGRAVTEATADSFKLLKHSKTEGGGWHANQGIDTEGAVKARLITSEEGALIKTLTERNVLSRGMHNDIARAANGSTNVGGKAWQKVQQVQSWAMEHVDLVGRLSSALAAYRLARAKGFSHEAAVDYAHEKTLLSNFDYTREGAARRFREGGGVPLAKLIFQFRRYQQGMLYLLADQAKAAFKGDKAAMATLAYMTMAHGLVAGAVGMPLAQSVLALANLFIPDDDPQGDAMTRMRNWLYDMTDDRDLARALAKGLPAYFGLDLSGRIGIGDLLTTDSGLPRGMERMGEGKSASDKINSTMGAILGPSAGAAQRIMTSLMYFGSGDFVKGTEYMLPSTFGNLIKAGRYATEGMTDSKGRQILGEDQFGLGDIMMRASGFQPAKESEYYEASSSKFNTENAIKTKRDSLVAQWVRARAKGDDTASIDEKISQFNESHHGKGTYGAINASEKLKALQSFRMNERQRGSGGVGYNPKRERDMEGLTRFVQ